LIQDNVSVILYTVKPVSSDLQGSKGPV